MELLLNLAWLLLALPAYWLWRDSRTTASRFRPSHSLLALGCMLIVLFPVVSATDYVKAYADQIRPFVRAPYRALGTDGLGRSDRRERLRHFFEVSRYFVALASLRSLVDAGAVQPATVRQALERWKIDPSKPDPATS